ncbi:MAG: hypothetical protein OXE52_07705 [Chloroflexi bacterium]|nr:hypothetical protein [Chloroflexota bacterium]
MNDQLFMGIDGGGTSLRIAITDGNTQVINSIKTSASNPNLLGHDHAQRHIRAAIDDCMRQAEVSPRAIQSAAIGIAGASAQHSRDWLIATVEPALPDSLLVAASDLEIALVGALAKRYGVLLLAGTGSAAFGISPAGRRMQIGGWGYLLGDPGSSYWIGMQVLKQMIDHHDSVGAGAETASNDALFDYVMQTLGIPQPRLIVDWLYRNQSPPATRIADIARTILNLAEDGNWRAINILQGAAIQLVRQTRLLIRRLDFPSAEIAFAGGLLEGDNLLSEDVARRLGLAERPVARHPPVIGAALLANMEWKRRSAASKESQECRAHRR